MSSRHFERSFTTDQLTLAAGDLATVDGGPITLAMVFRLDDVSPFQLLVQARTSGLAEVWAIGVDGGTLFFATSAGFRDGPTVSANTWYQYVATKAGGSAVVRDHLRNLSTGSWTHSDRGSALGDGSGTVSTVRVSDGSSARIDGYIAALGCGGFTPANDAAVEAYSGLSAWISAGMAAVLRMSDTPVNDLVGSTDQSALSGTTVETEDPGSNFTLTTSTTHTQTLSGSVTPAGAIVRQPAKTLTGATTPAGALLRQIGHLLAGATTPTGTAARQTSRTLTGATTPTGSPARQIAKTLTAAIIPAGTLANIRTRLLALAGAIAPSGTLQRQTGKATAGTATPTGTIQRALAKTLIGAVTPAGGLLKLLSKILGGTIAPSGAATPAATGAPAGTGPRHTSATPAGRDIQTAAGRDMQGNPTGRSQP